MSPEKLIQEPYTHFTQSDLLFSKGMLSENFQQIDPEKADKVGDYDIRLNSIDLDEPSVQASLFAQAVSAFEHIPLDKRNDGMTSSVVFMKNPDCGYIIAEVEGVWQNKGSSFEMFSICLLQAPGSLKEVGQFASEAKYINPENRFLSSDSFAADIEQARKQKNKKL